MVRVITSTFTAPARPGYGATHRLMTSFLDAACYPARELACAYHERWEVERAIDELDTHPRLLRHPWRRQKPVGVDPDRLSFTTAVRLICDAIPEFQRVAPERQPCLYPRRLWDIARD